MNKKEKKMKKNEMRMALCSIDRMILQYGCCDRVR